MRKNPVQALKFAGIAFLVGLAIWFAVDYSGSKRENRHLSDKVTELEADLAGEVAAREAAVTRIDDFVEAQARLERTLDQMQRDGAAFRAEVKGVLDGFNLSEIEALAQSDVDGASRVLNDRYRALQRLLHSASTPGGSRPPEP